MNKRFDYLRYISGRRPDAVACMRGGDSYPEIRGTVKFYSLASGVLVAAEITGLPCEEPQIFAFHIHGGSSCSDGEHEQFPKTMGHYDPEGRPHPSHAGDMPPLFGNNGRAFSAFLTDRFCVKDILGRTVIIHADPDDFKTQPSGNAGEKIACGEIKKY